MSNMIQKFELAPSAQATFDAVREQFNNGATIGNFASSYRESGDTFFAAVTIAASLAGLFADSAETFKGADGTGRKFFEQISLNSTDSARMYATEIVSKFRIVAAAALCDWQQIGGMSDLRKAAKLKAHKDVDSVGDVERHNEAGEVTHKVTLASVTIERDTIAAQAAQDAAQAEIVVNTLSGELEAAQVAQATQAAHIAKLESTIASLIAERDALAEQVTTLTAGKRNKKTA